MSAHDIATLADEFLAIRFDADPLGATLYGVPGYAGRLADLSEAAENTLIEQANGIAERAAAIDESTLDATGRVTRAMIIQQARAVAAQAGVRGTEFTVTDLFIAPAAVLLSALPMLSLPDEQRAQSYLDFLRAIPEHLRTAAQRHRDGLAAGRLPVRHLVEAAIAHLDRYLAAPDADPLCRPEPQVEVPGFAEQRDQVLAEVVRPAFAEYRDALANDIRDHGRGVDKPGLCWLPDGAAAYAALSAVHTTTDRTPEELHKTGLDIIASLTEEYAEIGGRVFGTTDRAEIFRRLRTDAAMRWSTGEEIIDAARAAVARAQAAAPDWFGRIPSQPCEVEPVPAASAPTAPMAYYMRPAVDGTRPGTYFANTDKPEQRDRYLAEVVAFHEAVPGHHFQISIAQSLDHLPELHRFCNVNAYTEGWGLYTERLAEEMGLYSGDVARLGMLAMDSIRAGRLVVDTGLHALGWSREQAIAYLTENTPTAPLDIANEVDRYIAFPGQALSYMVGRLELLRIRGNAEQALGDRFDIKAFHDVLLGNGALALNVLDDVVREWVSVH